jgi:hypothetical protein
VSSGNARGKSKLKEDSMGLENLEKVQVRGYDNQALAVEDELAGARYHQLHLLNSLERLTKNFEEVREVLSNFTELVKKSRSSKS